ncbi:MAG: hypothetical protein ABJB98_03390 [Actinomycetota bacterium]
MNDTITSASGSSAPRTILWTWYALIVAAVGSVLTSLALYGARSWLERTYRDGIVKNTAKHSAEQVQKDLDNLSHAVSNIITFQLIFGIVGAAILGFLAIRVKQGRHWTRWGVVGAFALMSLSGYSLIGLSGLLGIGSDAPLTFKAPAFLGAAAFVAAVILINVKPSSEFLNLGRPERTSAGGVGLRGLLGPRPPRGGATGPARPGSARAVRPAAAKPATTRPGSGTANGAAKGKARVAAQSAPPGSKPARTKNRGKAKGR